MSKDFRLFLRVFRRLYKSILGFEEGTDVEATIEGIKKDIGFRGPTAWILIFSIFIASIGLNVNSTAVIIGAMLISPLMGPILGVGLSIGIHDFDTLIRSIKNLGIAVFISICTSTLYFLLTPLNGEQPELLARIKPTILDVLVALFGGFAGIIAGSRKEKTNVIPGVAIATALMPPLCTVGYGIANLKVEYFLGAFYLFLINSIFISISTYVVVKYLKFPVKTFIDPIREKRYKRLVYACLIIVIAPSIYIFYSVIQEARFGVRANQFIQENCNFQGSDLLSSKITFSDTLSIIDLYYIGDEIDSTKESNLKDELKRIGLAGKNLFAITDSISIIIHQEADQSIDFEERLSELNTNLRVNLLQDLYDNNEKEIKIKDSTIKVLKKKISTIKLKDSIPYQRLKNEMSIHYPDVNKFSFANAIETVESNDTSYMDTIPIYIIQWRKRFSSNSRKRKVQKIEDWLRIRMENNKIKVIDY